MKNSLSRRIKKKMNEALERFNLEITLNTVTKRPSLKKKYRDYTHLSVLPKVPTIIEIGIRVKDYDSIKKYFPNARYHFINHSKIKLDKKNIISDLPDFHLILQGLDQIISEKSLKIPYGVRIDTPGQELETIKALKKDLYNTAFVMIEYHHDAAIRNKYTLQDIVKVMEGYGFIAYFIPKNSSSLVFLKKHNVY